jgi:hypothetical protein
MHSSMKHDESLRRDDAGHIRLVITEMQKALEVVIRSMSSTQDSMQSMATVMMAMCRAIDAGSFPGKQN